MTYVDTARLRAAAFPGDSGARVRIAPPGLPLEAACRYGMAAFEA